MERYHQNIEPQTDLEITDYFAGFRNVVTNYLDNVPESITFTNGDSSPSSHVLTTVTTRKIGSLSVTRGMFEGIANYFDPNKQGSSARTAVARVVEEGQYRGTLVEFALTSWFTNYLEKRNKENTLTASQQKALARAASKQIYEIVTNFQPNLDIQPKKLESEHPILTTSDLETLALLTLEHEDLAIKLNDPFDLLRTGLTITISDNPDEDNTALPIQLLSVAKSLIHTESQETLTEWINNYMTTEPDTVKTTITTLANFLMFLDSESLVKVYNVSTDAVPLQPFQGIHAALTEAYTWASQNYLELVESHSDNLSFVNYLDALNRTKTELRQTIAVVEASFKKALTLRKQNSDIAGQIETIDSLQPDVEEVTQAFWKYACDKIEKANLSTPSDDRYGTTGIHEKISREIKRLTDIAIKLPFTYCNCQFNEIVNHLNKLIKVRGLTDKKFRNNLLGRIIYEATRHGLISDKSYKRTVNFLLEQKMAEIRNGRWKEPTEVDWIKPETKNLTVYVVTGTFGPITPGHIDAIETLVHQETKEDEQTTVLVLPITKLGGLPGYNKGPEAGPLENRAGSIVLSGHWPRQDVLMSTAAQPIPGEILPGQNTPGSREDNLDTTILNIRNAIRKTHPDINIEFVQVCGSDELNTEDQHSYTQMISGHQPKKFTDPRFSSTLITRMPGHSVAIIGQINELRKTNVGQVILQNGHPGSSTNARKNRLRYHHDEGLMRPLILLPQIAGSWNSTAITGRKRGTDPIDNPQDYLESNSPEGPITIPMPSDYFAYQILSQIVEQRQSS